MTMADAEDQRETWRYQKELPTDRTQLTAAWKLLQSYSGIPSSEIEEHVTTIRDKAFSIFHYPCIGRWRFLDLYLSTAPEYPAILARLKAGDALLDLGCCFGQILRKLAFDGAPAANLTGADLRPEFIELGYELFRDKGTLNAQFVTGDVLDPSDTGIALLDGRFDIVHAASFFHLFGWDDQVKVGERIVRFFKPGSRAALVLGRQVGSLNPPTLEEYYQDQGGKPYHHNLETLQSLWNTIGVRTGTKWTVSGEMSNLEIDDIPMVIIRYAVSIVA